MIQKFIGLIIWHLTIRKRLKFERQNIINTIAYSKIGKKETWQSSKTLIEPFSNEELKKQQDRLKLVTRLLMN